MVDCGSWELVTDTRSKAACRESSLRLALGLPQLDVPTATGKVAGGPMKPELPIDLILIISGT
jgi:hypothetical protein